MGSSPRPPADRLTALQRDLLREIFARETGFFLTGGAALAGFYLHHRTTDDLDLFAPGTGDLRAGARALRGAVEALGGTLVERETTPDFRRFYVERAGDPCVVDLVIDRGPALDAQKNVIDGVTVDTVREIAANKICAILGRAEIKDLVDLRALMAAGRTLDSALADAERKDASANPATLAWVLRQITITSHAVLPADVAPADLAAFRDATIKHLRAIAFVRACPP